MAPRSTPKDAETVLSTVWNFACPSCRSGLTSTKPDERFCPRCDVTYRQTAGIWRLLVAGRQDAFREFVHQYETVRIAEGRAMPSAAHLRALPFRDLSKRRRYEWHIRAKSYETLIRRVVAVLEQNGSRTLRIVDLGSGVGWLAYRMTLRGHEVAAVDLLTNDFDGLGALHRCGCALPGIQSIQAEFDRLPFLDATVDLAIYNASFHYSKDYAATLRETLRVLRPEGIAVIMDTPIYRDASSGARMVREREQAFQRHHGFCGTRTQSFLTYDKLDELQDRFALRWELFEPWYGLRWWVKPWLARFRGLREPARFKLAVGSRRTATIGSQAEP